MTFTRATLDWYEQHDLAVWAELYAIRIWESSAWFRPDGVSVSECLDRFSSLTRAIEDTMTLPPTTVLRYHLIQEALGRLYPPGDIDSEDDATRARVRLLDQPRRERWAEEASHRAAATLRRPTRQVDNGNGLR